MITVEEAQNWIKRIRHTDWYYNYSDDYGAYSRGQAQCAAIRKDAEEADLTDEEVDKVIDVFMSEATNEKETTVNFIIDKINSVLRSK